jgi:hypothetical protein
LNYVFISITGFPANHSAGDLAGLISFLETDAILQKMLDPLGCDE